MARQSIFIIRSLECFQGDNHSRSYVTTVHVLWGTGCICLILYKEHFIHPLMPPLDTEYYKGLENTRLTVTAVMGEFKNEEHRRVAIRRVYSYTASFEM